jgi:regulator of RNase E activity RraA
VSNVGFRVFKKIHRPERSLVEQFRGIPCLDARLKPLNPMHLLGPALTVRARVGDNMMMHHAMDLAEPGDIIVVDGQGDLVNALSGENMMNWCHRRGLGGVVVDGAMRDVDAISRMAFPVYCAGIQPNGPYKNGPGEVNVPISCGGITVNPGDIISGDADGLICIPRQDAEAILERARKKMKQEAETAQGIVDGSWSRAAYSEETLSKLGCEFIDDYYA